MKMVQLDDDLRARLNGLSEQTLFCDGNGKPLGFFLPSEVYAKLSCAGLEVPFSKEEIERRRKDTGGCSLEEFWRRMGQT